VALPEGCQLTESHLLFWELATEGQLNDSDRIYEYCCTVACTNALRPLGMVEVVRHAVPDLTDGEMLQWGNRYLDAEASHGYTAAGYVLCELRLPVRPMVGPITRSFGLEGEDRPV
jgi:hypothetical protein